MSTDTNKSPGHQCLYFAYGSNMSIRRLQQRIASAHKKCRARLVKHQLRFHKHSHLDGSAKCDACITGNSTDQVEGIVYEIDLREKPQLDKIEGLGQGYETKQITVFSDSGESLEAYTYIATDIDASLKPYDWYKHHVLAGARENNLPQHYINQIAAIEAIADMDKQRCQRELEIYL